ncbi:MAG: hypothetical protein Q9159_005977 [Coniocarpon cinnabarinum]
MHFSTLALAAVAAPLAIAAPTSKRQQMALSNDDVMVLQLAHYLENLEYALYTGGCNDFTDADYQAAGFPAGFQENVCVIASHEATHRDTLAQILTEGGQTPLPACTYTFPYSDPVSFVDTANMITTGGIGAYLGGSELLTDSPTLEEAAGSILTVEARHDAYLRAGVGGSPFPTAFDTALTAEWIFSLVQMFIESCPMQLPGVVQLPKLMATAPAPQPHLMPAPAPGTLVEFKWDPSTFFNPVDSNAPLYIAMVNQNVSAPIFQQVQNLDFAAGTGSVPLPAEVQGIAFAALTTFSGGLDLNALKEKSNRRRTMSILITILVALFTFLIPRQVFSFPVPAPQLIWPDKFNLAEIVNKTISAAYTDSTNRAPLLPRGIGRWDTSAPDIGPSPEHISFSSSIGRRDVPKNRTPHVISASIAPLQPSASPSPVRNSNSSADSKEFDVRSDSESPEEWLAGCTPENGCVVPPKGGFRYDVRINTPATECTVIDTWTNLPIEACSEPDGKGTCKRLDTTPDGDMTPEGEEEPAICFHPQIGGKDLVDKWTGDKILETSRMNCRTKGTQSLRLWGGYTIPEEAQPETVVFEGVERIEG